MTDADRPDWLETILAGIPGANGQGPRGSRPPDPFPPPVPISSLKAVPAEARWLWEGCLARDCVTLFSALWKAGKSTILGHLLASLDAGTSLCGMRTKACKVLYVPEEPEGVVADRRDLLKIRDNVWVQPRPFPVKPRWDRWLEFLDHLRKVRERFEFEALVFDTISNLWPIRDENDATQVQSALMPLRGLGDGLAVMLVHHLRKGDGAEATGSRGSGALSAFADILLEFRRYNAGDRKDRRRVLTGYGRFRETPDELVVELSEDHAGYQAHGDREQSRAVDVTVTLDGVLPAGPPGMSYAEIVEAWPGEATPRKASLTAALDAAVEGGRYGRSGAGRKGSPYLWWNPPGGPPQDSVSVPFPYREGTETESVDGDSGGGNCPFR